MYISEGIRVILISFERTQHAQNVIYFAEFYLFYRVKGAKFFI